MGASRLISWSRPGLRFGSALIALSLGWMTVSGSAQQLPQGSAQQLATAELPQSPGVVAAQQAGASSSAEHGDAATISGVVLDVSGAGVAGARVTLVGPDGKDERVISSASHGEFSFDGLGRGPYRVVILAAGLEPFVSPQIPLTARQTYELPGVSLRIATANTTVQVTLSVDEIATEQVKIEEKQRVLGIVPNFYTSFVEHPAPLAAKQKFSLAAHTVFDPTAFVGAGLAAGVEQVDSLYPGYGYGVAGYAKRYAAAYGDQLTDRMFSAAIYPSLLRQDPRYFYRGTGTIKSRAIHAIVSAWVIRTDSGGHQPNYSYVLGSLTSGGLSNFYYPHADRGAGLVFTNMALGLAGHAADNLVREFVLKTFTTNVPVKSTAKP